MWSRKGLSLSRVNEVRAAISKGYSKEEVCKQCKVSASVV